MELGLEQMYNTYYMQVYSFVMTLSRNQQLSEEITQKTFFRAMSTEKKHRGESSEFTWLCTIAKNLFIDEQRTEKRYGDLSNDHPSEGDILETVTDSDSLFRIHQVLHDMEEPYKEVFQLRVFGELPFSKIAILFSKTETWARVTYHRARIKIQERMDI